MGSLVAPGQSQPRLLHRALALAEGLSSTDLEAASRHSESLWEVVRRTKHFLPGFFMLCDFL